MNAQPCEHCNVSAESFQSRQHMQNCVRSVKPSSRDGMGGAEIRNPPIAQGLHFQEFITQSLQNNPNSVSLLHPFPSRDRDSLAPCAPGVLQSGSQRGWNLRVPSLVQLRTLHGPVTARAPWWLRERQLHGQIPADPRASPWCGLCWDSPCQSRAGITRAHKPNLTPGLDAPKGFCNPNHSVISQNSAELPWLPLRGDLLGQGMGAKQQFGSAA